MDETTELYQNTGYSFDRIQRRTLVLDKTIGIATSFDEKLQEPLIIDKLSDIYLDNFTTFDALINTGTDSIAFLIGVDQLNIKTSTNNATFKDKVSIPNEEATGGSKMKVHKGKKYNFICTINPTTLSKLSGTITNIASTPATNFGSSGRFILELLIISRDI